MASESGGKFPSVPGVRFPQTMGRGHWLPATLDTWPSGARTPDWHLCVLRFLFRVYGAQGGSSLFVGPGASSVLGSLLQRTTDTSRPCSIHTTTRFRAGWRGPVGLLQVFRENVDWADLGGWNLRLRASNLCVSPVKPGCGRDTPAQEQLGPRPLQGTQSTGSALLAGPAGPLSTCLHGRPCPDLLISKRGLCSPDPVPKPSISL